MRRIAIVGFAPETKYEALNLYDDVEIWTGNRSWVALEGSEHLLPGEKPWLKKIDLMLEIHPLAWLKSKEADAAHWEWLQKGKRDWPILTAETLGIPNEKLYPFDDVIHHLTGWVGRPDKPIIPLTSTVDYLFALAVLFTHMGGEDSVAEIYLPGIQMRDDTEWKYQRPALAYWLGQCQATGILVHIPEASTLWRPKVYHTGGQMLSRHFIEKHKAYQENVLKEKEMEFHRMEGAIQVSNGKPSPELQQNYMHVQALIWKLRGAIEQCELLIDTLDKDDVSPALSE